MSKSSILPRRQKNVLFDLFFTRFGRTSRKAARAVRDFVTCSSPGSNGFMEDITTPSQESPIDLPSSQDVTPSTTTSNLQQIPRDKLPVRDLWSVRNGVSPPPSGIFRHRDFKDVTRLPSHCHWKSAHARAVANAECNRRASGVEVTSTSTCGAKLPSNFFELPTKQRLRAVKHFLAEFVYKPNSETSLQANKQRPLCRLMATARMIVYKPEPIKSVEAVFLALYLTAGLLVDRIPVCFKTKFEDEVCQHMVVLVQHNGKYGAFGISSDPDLMTKDFQFDSMSSIIENFMKAYKASAHTVLKIRIGLPVEHDIMSTHFICWRHVCLSPEVVSWEECVVEIENHVLRMRRLWDLWVLTGKGDDPRKAKWARRKVDTNCNPRGKVPTEKQADQKQVATPPEVKKHVEGSQAPPQAMISTQRHQWDAESTGSNTDDCEHCEHCEQLKRAVPPSDTKRASVTTVKRIKTSGSHHDTASTKVPSQQHHSHSTEWEEEAESFESNTGDHDQYSARTTTTKPSVHFQQPRALNHASLAATKQILKNFVTSSVLSTPPRRSSNRRDQSTRKLAADHPKVAQPGDRKVMRRTRDGPLYHFALAGGGKSKAG